jgi:predicted nucleic acid-binding protein
VPTLPYIGKSLFSHAVLIDTGAILALTNHQHINHSRAVDCLAKINDRKLPVLVSLPVIYETHKRILFDLGRIQARQFLIQIYDRRTTIIRTESADEERAKALLDRYRDLGMTLTDAVSMAIMERFGIAASFSFDRHFLQAGFIRIPPFHLG